MLKSLFLTILFFLFSYSIIAQSKWTIEEMAPMPEPVTNNAVCEGFISGFAGNIPYVFSFGGINSTLVYTGIHNKSWRYNTETDIWESIADIPGPEKTIATSASYVNGKIYIMGGYTVAANGNEVSSDKVYIYNVQNNIFETNGAAIPVAIDDQVQCVYHDSLIYIVSGWSNTGNVNNVQIYDTYNDTWQVGTSVPNTSDFKVFGSNGTIVNDTLYYYGGANTTTNFPATNRLKKGYINPNDPTNINWSLDDFNLFTAYRLACTSVEDTVFWIGGSETSYNYNAVAYDGSGIVDPKNITIRYHKQYIETVVSNPLPMDLRGIASVSSHIKFLCGGIETNAKVSNKTLKLTWKKTIETNISKLNPVQFILQNPIQGKILFLKENFKEIRIYSSIGELVFQDTNNTKNDIDLTFLNTGVYFLKLDKFDVKKIILD